MDIRFYNFDFELLYILPAYTKNTGYISIHTTQKTNENGSFEVVFRDNQLVDVVEKNADNMIVCWNGFQGFVTSYRWDKELRITGLHLNGILHRVIIPSIPQTKATVGDISRNIIKNNVEWIVVDKGTAFEKQIDFSTDKYKYADELFQELLKLDNTGYQITADFINKRYKFDFIKSQTNSLILSEKNLNAYDFETTYINKEKATGGWYEKDGVWLYASLDESKGGIYKQDVILSVESDTEALNELKLLNARSEIVAKTKNIKYLDDYKLGDIIRVQISNSTTEKYVAGTSMWYEKNYGEEPILEEVL